MDNRIKDQWASALESGDYQQIQGAMRVEDKFCPLGVLCNLHAQVFGGIAQDQKEKSMYMGHTADLPYGVLHWSGLEDEQEDLIIDWNDRKRLSFQEIATLIRNTF